jgi:hypothetical protein
MKKLLFTLLFLFIPFSVYADVNSDIEECRQNEWESRADDCIEDIALELKDLSICEEASYAFDCYIEFALRYDDERICDISIAGDSWKSTCHELVNPTTKTLEGCMELMDYKRQSECIFSLARQNNNAELCSDIYTPNIKEQCEVFFPDWTPEPQESDIQTDTSKNPCEGSIVKNYISKDVCNQLQAKKTNNPQLCFYIEDIEIKEKCLATNSDSAELCEAIQNEETKKSCYLSAAINSGNADFCYKTRDSYQEGCIRTVLHQTGNIDICLKMKETSGNTREFDECVSEIAKTEKNVSYCDEIENSSTKAACKRNAFIDTENSEDCLDLPGQEERDQCLFSQAQYRDISEAGSICGQITDSELKFNCVPKNVEGCNMLSKKTEGIAKQYSRERCYQIAHYSEAFGGKTIFAMLMALMALVITLYIHIKVFRSPIEPWSNTIFITPFIPLATYYGFAALGLFEFINTFVFSIELIFYLNVILLAVQLLSQGASNLYKNPFIAGIKTVIGVSIPIILYFTFLQTMTYAAESQYIFMYHISYANRIYFLIAVAGITFLLNLVRSFKYEGGAALITNIITTLLLAIETAFLIMLLIMSSAI